MSIILPVYVGEEKGVKKVKERVGANEKRHSRHEMKEGTEAPSPLITMTQSNQNGVSSALSCFFGSHVSSSK